MKNSINVRTFTPRGGTAGTFSLGFVYVIKFGTHWKIGISRKVEDCLAQARRWDVNASVVICWPVIDHGKLESQIHAALTNQGWHRGGEQFDLPSWVRAAMAELDDYQFALWADVRFAVEGLKDFRFTNIYSDTGARAWRCSFFPDECSAGHVLMCGEVKPKYLEVLELWRSQGKTHPEAFRVARVLDGSKATSEEVIVALATKCRLYERWLGINQPESDYAI